MSILDEIINITINQSSGSIVTQDFNSLLIMVNDIPNASFGDETVIKQYTSLTDIQTDFGVNTEIRKIAAKIFSQPYVPSKILVATKHNGPDNQPYASYSLLYTYIKSERDDFKFIISSANDVAEILEISLLAETNKKIYGVTSTDQTIPIGQNDILSQLKNLNRTRTFLFFSYEELYIEAALIAYMSQYPVGSATWAYKSLSNVLPSIIPTVGRQAIEVKNGNYYTQLAGKNCTFFGILTDGSYIDGRLGIDWFEQITKENLAVLLTDQAVGKIPYTQAGIDLIENNIRASCQQAADRSIINSDFIIEIPKYSAVSAQDKAARTLNSVKIRATKSDAIHKINIIMTITY